MLNKDLCAAFGIDEYSQWLIKQLDYIEDQLHATEISTPRYLELRGQYDALKAARDAYCTINQNKLKQHTKKEATEDMMTIVS